MRYDHQWHRARAREGRGQGWDKPPVPTPRSHGPWLRLGVLALIGAIAGLAIAEGLSATDRSRYDRLLSSVDIAPPGGAGTPQG
ncbi:hypothetical protein NDN01_14375 [Sphingomonas sp. QA11]|uniref:hypothetical protein n=1 Tax=Sphingomonas sp. QA11 TaxID=2950605 RepID=UPI00234B1639|nr:hypothetical protein [Sphingomonas sp. QA11]WCM25254.1 hypothetical protein NDN01_14375 [Sphingomonas sp. QA11]